MNDQQVNRYTRETFYTGIAERIREKRDAAGLSRDQLAAECKLSTSTILHAEEGSVTVLVLARIATALDCMLDELVAIGSES